MERYFLSGRNKGRQFFVSILLVCLIAFGCYFLSDIIGYRIVALILLVTVSLIAMFFDILPVLLAALLSALIWNFFFIPPKFTFAIGSTEDVLMFLMYFVIASINGVLTFKIRQMAKEAIKREEKEKTLYLYNTILNSLSHELRTPISTVIAASDNLQGDSKISEANKRELVHEISSAALRLNHQVENLLNMSRLESGFLQVKVDWTDISELIYDVLKRVEQNKITQKISIEVDPHIPLFKIDKPLLEEALYNLVRNATLYTNENSTIKIGARGLANNLEINVEDNGPGFPPDEIEKVFDKFYRLKNTKTGGTGLGLSIARGFIEAQDGSIELKNVPSGGAQFKILIPAESSPMKV